MQRSEFRAVCTKFVEFLNLCNPQSSLEYILTITMPQGKNKSAIGRQATNERAGNCGTCALPEQPKTTRKRTRRQNQEISDNRGSAERQSASVRRERIDELADELRPEQRSIDEPLTRSDIIITLIQEAVRSLECSNNSATTHKSEPQCSTSNNPSATSPDNTPPQQYADPMTLSGLRKGCSGLAGASIETTQPGMFTLYIANTYNHTYSYVNICTYSHIYICRYT